MNNKVDDFFFAGNAVSGEPYYGLPILSCALQRHFQCHI